MAVTSALYGKMVANVFGGETVGESIAIDWLSDTIKVMLTTNSYTPNQDTDEFLSTPQANEVTIPTGGYVAGGMAVPTRTLSYASRVTTFSSAVIQWTITGTVTARRAVFYKDTGSAATSPLIGWQDFGEDVTATDGTFTLTPNASGLFTLTVSALA